MPKRAISVTKAHIISAPLPQATETYTVLSHEFVINKALSTLKDKGFEVEQELYRCSQNADIATGTYHLKYEGDPEMGMMFAWSNSYNKQLKFGCVIGGYVKVSGSKIISGNMGSWRRKHTGTADTEASDTIYHQIDSAEIYYKQLVSDKEKMKDVEMLPRTRAELLGRIYLEHELLTSEQLSVVKHEIKNPSFVYSSSETSLWHLYNHIIFALQRAHPKNWMDQQRMVHWFLCNEFKIESIEEVVPQEEKIVDRHQMTIEEGIAQAEAENS